MKAVLDGVSGVSEKTRQALLTWFGSVGGVCEASVEDLANVPGVGGETADELRRRF